MKRLEKLRYLCKERDDALQKIKDELEKTASVYKDSDVFMCLDLTGELEGNLGQPDGITLIREDQRFFLTQAELEGLVTTLKDWGLL
jgi:hypothetical protein